MGKMQAKAETWELAGWAGVDSGRLMLADPCYPEQMPKEFLEGLVDEDGTSAWMVNGQAIAMIIGIPCGDGLYPVHVMEDKDGQITAVRVDFTREACEAAH